VPAGSGFYSEGGKEGANYVHRNTPHIHYDSTKHCFLPPKIAGEEMASKYYKLEQLGTFCTTSEFKACDLPLVVQRTTRKISAN